MTPLTGLFFSGLCDRTLVIDEFHNFDVDGYITYNIMYHSMCISVSMHDYTSLYQIMSWVDCMYYNVIAIINVRSNSKTVHYNIY